MQRFIKDGALWASVVNAGEKELEKLDPNDEQYKETRDQVDGARQNLHQIQANTMLLSRTPNVADVVAGNLVKQFTKPDGTYDEDGAAKSLETLQLNSGLKQSIREKLTPGAAPDILNTPENFKKALGAVQDFLSQGKTMEFVIDQINRTRSFSARDKSKLIDELNKKTQAEDQTVPGPAGAVQSMFQKTGPVPVPEGFGVAMQ
jgi:hypothetical protein